MANVVHEISFRLSAQSREVQQSLQTVGRALQSVGNSARTLNNAWSGGSGGLRAYMQDLNRVQSTISNYQRAMANVQNAYRAMQNAQNQSQRTQAEANYYRQRDAAARLAQSLRDAGFSTSNLSQTQSNLENQINRTTQALERQARVDTARQNFQHANQNLSSAFGNFQGAVSTSMSVMNPFVNAVEGAVEFEAAMSKVKALTQTGLIKEGKMEEVEKNMRQLENQAKELGATTQFTMTQAAEAQSYLGMAGWKTEQIVGTLPGMLNLAAGAGTELARTADIVSDNMTAMGVPVEKATHFMDVYAYALTNSNVNLESLGETMKYAAPIANAFGATLEDATAMTMMMGNAGVKGSQAGTSLRMGLLRLSGPPKKASKEMEELGISMSDATKMAYETEEQLKALGISVDQNADPMDKMENIIDQLCDKTAGLSREEKLAAVSSIFGANAATGWVNILEQGKGTFKQYRDALRNSDGYAKQFAETQTDNTKGSLTAFSSALDAVSKSIAENYLPYVRQAAETGTQWATSLATWINENPRVATALGAATVGFAALTVAVAGASVAVAGVNFVNAQIQLAKVTAEAYRARLATTQFFTTMQTQGIFAAAKQGLTSLATSFGTVARAAMGFAFSPVGIALMALGAAAYYVYNNWAQVAPVFQNLAAVFQSSLGSSIQSLSPALNNLWGAFQRLLPAIEQVGGVIFKVLITAANVVIRVASIIVNAFSNAISFVMNLFSGLGDTIASLLAGDFSAAGEHIKNTLSQAAGDFGKTLTDAFAGVKDLSANIFTPLEIMQNAQTNVQTAGTPTAQPQPIDITQAQNSVNELGNSAQQTSQSVQDIGTSTQALGENVNQISQTLSAESFQPLTQSISEVPAIVQPTNEQLQQATMNLTAQNEQVAQSTANIMTNSAQIQQATAELSSFNMNLSATNGGLQTLSSNASQAGASLSSLVSAIYQAVANIGSAASSAMSSITARAATVSTAQPVAANAEGGIYRKGAFLTTFAEKSPEAAIPLDGSRRAVDLWRTVGAMLGIENSDTNGDRTENTSKISIADTPPVNLESLMTHGTVDKKSQSEISTKKSIPHIVNNEKSQQKIKGLKFENFNPFTAMTSTIGGVRQTPENLADPVKRSKSYETLTRASNNQIANPTDFLNIFTPDTESVFDKVINMFNGNVKSENIPPQNDNIPLMSPINLSITINGNADENTIQTAGDEIITRIKREIFGELEDKIRNKSRSAFY